MTPETVINTLLTVPYVRDRGDLGGADCFGIVELWFRMVDGIEINDRADHQSSHAGLQAGFDAHTDWEAIDGPEDGCVVVMRAGRHPAGHIGICWRGSVLHSDEAHGCVFEALSKPFIRSRITGFYRHS